MSRSRENKIFSEVVIRAPAKINLGLEVGRRRRDGYHELRTLFQAVSISDTLRIRRTSKGVKIRCPRLPLLGRKNLAWQAADLFLRRTGAKGGLEIHLEKRIPAGGGLGGGSSDAAAVLLGACRLFGLKPPTGELSGWAAELGSDVPFFVSSGAALGSGRGEMIESLRGGPTAPIVVYDPGFSVSTAEIYGDYRRRLTKGRDKLRILVEWWKKGKVHALGKALFNDLEETVFRRHPSLVHARDCMVRRGASGALVSGSGACLFGIFKSGPEAVKASRSLTAALPGHCRTARFLPHRQFWGVVKR